MNRPAAGEWILRVELSPHAWKTRVRFDGVDVTNVMWLDLVLAPDNWPTLHVWLVADDVKRSEPLWEPPDWTGQYRAWFGALECTARFVPVDWSPPPTELRFGPPAGSTS